MDHKISQKKEEQIVYQCLQTQKVNKEEVGKLKVLNQNKIILKL